MYGRHHEKTKSASDIKWLDGNPELKKMSLLLYYNIFERAKQKSIKVFSFVQNTLFPNLYKFDKIGAKLQTKTGIAPSVHKNK